MALKKRQRLILQVLRKLGGEASTKEIAEKTNLHVNGVAQSLGALYEYVDCLGGKGGDTMWKINQ